MARSRQLQRTIFTWEPPRCEHGHQEGYCTDQSCPYWWQEPEESATGVVLPATRIEIPAELRRLEWHRRERCWELVLVVTDEVAEDMGRFVGMRRDAEITIVAEARPAEESQ